MRKAMEIQGGIILVKRSQIKMIIIICSKLPVIACLNSMFPLFSSEI